jgi:SAM-dependent methyltransferase
MDHSDHVRLIREGVTGGGPDWADLGSGRGAFTLALADLLGPASRIVSVDRDPAALSDQARELRRRFPGLTVDQRLADFRQPLDLHRLDGIVMANSLHFVRDKAPVLALVRGYLRDGGRLVLVEYDADRGNPWVPFPLSFETWRTVAAGAGFGDTRRLASVPSRVLGSIYSAASLRPGDPAPQ